MKGINFLLALSAMALATGCSNDEMTEVNNGNAIDFSVTASKQSRAVTTTNTISEFKVWAFTDGKTYMDGLKVTKANDKWTYDDTKFWPESSVNFFAVSPSTLNSGTVSVANDAQSIKDYEVNGSEDLLYSANIDEKKADHASSPVAVNFRHALSQVVVKVKNIKTGSIKVAVNGVMIENIANKSTLTWAIGTTSTSLSTDTETGSTWGTWAKPEGSVAYTLEGTSIEDLAAEATEWGMALLMPQTLEAWDRKPYDASNTSVVWKSNRGARILVDCTITDFTSGVQLWPEPSTGKNSALVAIPLDNPQSDPNATAEDNHQRWMQGKKYVYTLVFGEGGGFEPGPDPTDPDPNPDPDPKPVLVPISFTVTVDEFQDGGTYNVDMKDGNTTKAE